MKRQYLKPLILNEGWNFKKLYLIKYSRNSQECNALRTLINNPFKEKFYGKEKKKQLIRGGKIGHDPWTRHDTPRN